MIINKQSEINKNNRSLLTSWISFLVATSNFQKSNNPTSKNHRNLPVDKIPQIVIFYKTTKTEISSQF